MIKLLLASIIVVIISVSAILQAEAAKAPAATRKDTKPPTIKITSPLTGSYVAVGSVLAKGSAADTESGIKSVTARIDANSFVTVTPVKPDWSSWQVSLNVATVGSHTLEVKATDNAGNTKSSSITIIAQDKIAPLITVPQSFTVEANEAGGRLVTYTATATDNVDGNINPTCVPLSGSLFPIGTTTVTCNATDSSGNTASAAFNVVAADTQAPHLSVPNDIVSYVTTIDYTVSAYDDVDGLVQPVCSPDSGSLFPVSVTTVVQCSATDAHGNTVSASFTVSVQEVGTWFYSSKFSELNETLVDELIGKNINTIYFSNVNEKFKQTNYEQKIAFIDYAKSRGMQVFAVMLQDPLYVLKTDAELQYKFNGIISATEGVFDTYVSDVEPHTICKIYPQYPCFSSDETYYLESYINMSKVLRAVADDNNVKYIDSVPWWYDRDIKSRSISPAGLDALSGHSINILDYASTKTLVMDRIPDAMATRYVINIKVTQTIGDPWLEGQELHDTISALQDVHLPYGIFEAKYVLTADESF